MLTSHPAIKSAAAPADRAAAATRNWKAIRKLPLAFQLQYLNSADAQRSMDAKTRSERIRAVELRIVAVGKTAPSISWLDAMIRNGISLPAETIDRLREHDVRMRLSREMTRIGTDGTPSRRWMPPQSVDVEDRLDQMNAIEAAYYQHPISPSALAIARIEMCRAKPIRQNFTLGGRKR